MNAKSSYQRIHNLQDHSYNYEIFIQIRIYNMNLNILQAIVENSEIIFFFNISGRRRWRSTDPDLQKMRQQR